MAITTAQIRELVDVRENILSDASFNIVIQAEMQYIQAMIPDIKVSAMVDMALVDLIKLRLAYDGLSALSKKGYSATWNDRRMDIIGQLESTLGV